MNTLAQVLSREEVKAIVESSNSFSREVMVANRELIKAIRAEKRERLAKATGSQVALIIDQKRDEGFVLTDIKTKEGKRSDTLTFTMKRANSLSELERMEREIAKLMEKKARLEAMAA